MPQITLIAAIGQRGEIGQDGELPWPKITEDFKHFKHYTNGKPVIMGRNTWESLPPQSRPLPGRRNIVLTHQPDFTAENATVVADTTTALAAAGDVAEVVIIGGAQIYDLFLDHADLLVLSEIQAEYPEADAFFPDFSCEDWAENPKRRLSYEPVAETGLPAFQVCYYERRR